jgi:hypothetical protein
MTASISFTINQPALDQILRAQGGPVARDGLRRGLRVETAAKRFCPVDTGRLRADISVWQTVSRDGIATHIGNRVEYAIFVHEGTRYIRARPYLRRALESAID